MVQVEAYFKELKYQVCLYILELSGNYLFFVIMIKLYCHTTAEEVESLKPTPFTSPVKLPVMRIFSTFKDNVKAC